MDEAWQLAEPKAGLSANRLLTDDAGPHSSRGEGRPFFLPTPTAATCKASLDA